MLNYYNLAHSITVKSWPAACFIFFEALLDCDLIQIILLFCLIIPILFSKIAGLTLMIFYLAYFFISYKVFLCLLH